MMIGVEKEGDKLYDSRREDPEKMNMTDRNDETILENCCWE